MSEGTKHRWYERRKIQMQKVEKVESTKGGRYKSQKVLKAEGIKAEVYNTLKVMFLTARNAEN